MGAVRDNNFFVVHGWMVNRLQLKGNDLRVYAIIYGFSQTGGQEFTGSLQYLADWVNGTKQGVQKNLKALLDRGLIKKREYFTNGVKQCAYRATELPPIQQSCTGYATELHEGMQQSCMGYATELHGGMQQSCNNNIGDNIPDNIPDTIEDKNTPKAPKGGDVQERRFAAFWEAYPKKVGKEAARKAWKKVKPDAALHERILMAVDTAKGCDQWRREGGRYIPNPATWLNQGRWDDEPTQAFSPARQPQQAQTSNPFLAALQNEGVM